MLTYCNSLSFVCTDHLIYFEGDESLFKLAVKLTTYHLHRRGASSEYDVEATIERTSLTGLEAFLSPNWPETVVDELFAGLPLTPDLARQIMSAMVRRAKLLAGFARVCGIQNREVVFFIQVTTDHTDEGAAPINSFVDRMTWAGDQEHEQQGYLIDHRGMNPLLDGIEAAVQRRFLAVLASSGTADIERLENTAAVERIPNIAAVERMTSAEEVQHERQGYGTGWLLVSPTWSVNTTELLDRVLPDQYEEGQGYGTEWGNMAAADEQGYGFEWESENMAAAEVERISAEEYEQQGYGMVPASSAAIDEWLGNAAAVVEDVKRVVEGEYSCMVCLEKLLLDEEGSERESKAAVPLPCKHLFHRGCITTWLKQSNSCPVCRRKI